MTDTIEAPEVDDPLPAQPAAGGLWAFVRLVAALAAITAVFLAFGLGDLLLVIVALIVMIVLHEFGHFITAKRSGMKVTEFFVGFGPRLWSVRRGETEYGIKAIPAGGYCRIIGMTSAEELHPSDEPRAYRNQAFWKRITVASAGSAMHFLIALVLAFIALSFIGRPDPSVVQVSSYLQISGGTATPAQQGGLRPGDVIVSVNGKKVGSDSSLSSVVHSSVGTPVTLVVDRDGQQKTIHVTPIDGRKVIVDGSALAPANGPATGYLGVSLAEGSSRVGPVAALTGSIGIIREVTAGSVSGIVHLFSPAGISNYAHQVAHPPASVPTGSSAAQAQASSRPESIIGAVRTASQAAQAGALALIEVLISINIFIGVINMLPMLPLDGGHVAIALYERIRTRRGRPMYRADITKMMPAVYAFVAVLLVLVMSSMYLDLTHPAANPFH